MAGILDKTAMIATIKEPMKIHGFANVIDNMLLDKPSQKPFYHHNIR
jgi:hypothetical protein